MTWDKNITQTHSVKLESLQNVLFLVSVVECDGDGGLGDASLAVLVDELLQVGGSHMAQVGDAQQETDGVQDVAFTGPEVEDHFYKLFSITKPSCHNLPI